MNKKNFYWVMALNLWCSWLLLTLVTDILILPTVFRTLNNIVLSGKLGMVLFSKINAIEVILAVVSLTFIFFSDRKNMKILSLAFILVFWSMLYKFYMTPQITKFGTLMHTVGITPEMFSEYSKIHSNYHHAYKILDSIKMLLIILIMSLVCLFRGEKE